jgi:hypothetical protein
MGGILKGVAIGGLNVLVIAIGIAAMDSSLEPIVIVTTAGMIPGLIAGAILGAVAQLLADRPAPLRVAVLFLPAFFVVVMLATAFAMQEQVLVSSIPTLVSALVLERWTRRVEPPLVPPAQIR